jgi:hypothetical protein
MINCKTPKEVVVQAEDYVSIHVGKKYSSMYPPNMRGSSPVVKTTINEKYQCTGK